MKFIKLITFYLLSLSGMIHAENFNIGECKVFGSVVVSTWTEIDLSGGGHTFGAVGNYGDIPSLWTVQEITADNPSTTLSEPILFMNSLGDILAVWTYYDNTLSYTLVGAARLQNGSTTWVVDVISGITPQETVQPGELTASIGDTGNIFVSWTSFDYLTQTFIIKGVYGSVTGVWGTPFQLGL